MVYLILMMAHFANISLFWTIVVLMPCVLTELLQLFAVESTDANQQTHLNQNQIAKNQFSCFQRITKDSHVKSNHEGAQVT